MECANGAISMEFEVSHMLGFAYILPLLLWLREGYPGILDLSSGLRMALISQKGILQLVELCSSGALLFFANYRN